MHTLVADLRYALRQLRRAPGFAITAVLTLALGIGATTAVYSVAYGVLIDPFPYHDVQTLATPKICVPDQPRCSWRIYTASQVAQIAQRTDIFTGVAASAPDHVTLMGRGAPERLRGNYITANTFAVLGVEPILGRASADLDVQPGHGEVALISYRFWQRHFGGKPSALGTVIDVEHRSRTIIGIMPQRFLWRGADLYLPIPVSSDTDREGPGRYALVGRVRPSVTSAQAATALQPLFEDFRRTNPAAYPAQMRVSLMPFAEMFASGLDDVLHLLLGAVVLLLLIACANVSSLLLARAVSRDREFALRAALGASARRLMRAAFTESLALALIALPVALLFAYASLQLILRIVPPETIPDEAVVSLNVPVLLASLGIACVTILVFGMAPAWRSSRPHLVSAMQSAFAAAAMLLTLVGIYGVLAFVTAQRTKEIGIRIALGARPLHVIWMVVRQAAILAVIGVAVGLPLALAGGHFAQGQLIHTSQRDPITLLAAICILPLLALTGTLLPARRATAINPTEALRAD